VIGMMRALNRDKAQKDGPFAAAPVLS
jgi:hypothetical protein